MSNSVELCRRVTWLGSGIGVAALAAAGFLAACGDSEDPGPAGSGGTTGSGGSQATGGTSTETGGTSTETGGTSTETGGTSTGSGGASGGTTSTGGSATTGGAAGSDPCAPCTPAECSASPIAPTNALITDWADVNPEGMFVDGDAYSTAPIEPPGSEWWNAFFGGPFVYPVTDECGTSEYPLTSTTSGGAWNITGTVGNYSGAGLWFGGCAGVDLSAYTGISFTISGTVGTAGTVVFNVATPENTAPKPEDCFTNINTCTAATCAAPSYSVTVTETQQTVSVLWADFTGGAPNAAVNPAQITGMQWVFPWEWECTVESGGDPASCAYDINVTIDNITLLP